VHLTLLPPEGRDLILAGAILSIFVNPLFFAALDRFRHRHAAVAAPGDAAATAAPPRDMPATALTGHAVVVGHGRVGTLVADGLRRSGLPVLVVEDQDERSAAARLAGYEVVHANGAHPDTIAAANLGAAQWLFVAIPNAFEAGQIVEQARALAPELPIVARAHFDAEIEHLRGMGATAIIMGEHELARGMLDHALGKQKPFDPATRPAW